MRMCDLFDKICKEYGVEPHDSSDMFALDVDWNFIVYNYQTDEKERPNPNLAVYHLTKDDNGFTKASEVWSVSAYESSDTDLGEEYWKCGCFGVLDEDGGDLDEFYGIDEGAEHDVKYSLFADFFAHLPSDSKVTLFGTHPLSLLAFIECEDIDDVMNREQVWVVDVTYKEEGEEDYVEVFGVYSTRKEAVSTIVKYMNRHYSKYEDFKQVTNESDIYYTEMAYVANGETIIFECNSYTLDYDYHNLISLGGER